MFRRARRRVHVALVVIVCLLFQQVAVAAYACGVEKAATRAQTTHCEHMNASPPALPVSALCDKHCSPDSSVLTDNAALAVPALALPPAFSLVLHGPSSQVHRDTVPILRSDPPPRLRYCTLLI